MGLEPGLQNQQAHHPEWTPRTQFGLAIALSLLVGSFPAQGCLCHHTWSSRGLENLHLGSHCLD
jgi:hypothetical protein